MTTERDATAALAAAGTTVAGVASLLQRNPIGLVELRRAEDQAERGGMGWIARMARAACSMDARGDSPAAAAAIREECLDDGDRWGAALATLFQAAGLLNRADGAAEAVLSEAAERFHELRAGRLQRLARDLESSTSILRGVAPQTAPTRAVVEANPTQSPTLELRCFGRLRATVDGQVIDLTAVKPRVRSLLRLLGAQAGEPVHREVVCEALWPETDPATGLRNLQVAVSSLRRLLEPRVSRGGGAIVVRDGDSYRLALPGASTCDVITYRRLLADAMQLAESDSQAAATGFAAAASLLRTGLLPEEGPAEWAEAIRERCRVEATGVGLHIAERARSAGDASAAALVCADTVEIDRYLDPAWRLLIAVHEQHGDNAAAQLTRLRYQEILAELGVATPAHDGVASAALSGR